MNVEYFTYMYHCYLQQNWTCELGHYRKKDVEKNISKGEVGAQGLPEPKHRY